MWAMGDYPAVATEVIAALGPMLVAATRIGPANTSSTSPPAPATPSIPAAQAGADVVASDLTPDLIETGRQAAAAAGVALRWEVDDAEHLPYADAEFDAAISCVGIMFAPHHQQAADELVRVVRPGGRIGLISWTPAGFIGQMFATMKPFAPPPPPGAQPPPLWGDEATCAPCSATGSPTSSPRSSHCRCRCSRTARRSATSSSAPTGRRSPSTGPSPTTRHRTAELDEALAAHGDRYVTDGPMEWEYLLFTARRA